MEMIKTLSGLNWAIVALNLCGTLVFGLMSENLRFTLVAFAAALVVSAPHAYLAVSVEKGRARLLQTIVAVLWLFAFPIGTAAGAFALWVCWSGDSRQVFDDGEAGHPPVMEPKADARDDDTPPPRAARLSRRELDVANAPTERKPVLRGSRPPPKRRG